MLCYNHKSCFSFCKSHNFCSSNIDYVIDLFESLIDGLAQIFNPLVNISLLVNINQYFEGVKRKKLFLDVINSVDGKLNITCPSRISSRDSKTCIGNIITVIKEQQTQSFIFKRGVFDYLAQLAVVSPSHFFILQQLMLESES